MFLLTLALIVSCESGPKKPNLETDVCANCTMILSQKPFICQTHMADSTHYFESIECLTAYSIKNESLFQLEQSWVTHFGPKAEWIPLKKVHFVRSTSIRSPMGLGLVGLTSAPEADKFVTDYGGEVLSWNQVKKFIIKAWF